MPLSPEAAWLWRAAWHTSPARPASTDRPPWKSSTERLRFESAASAVRRPRSRVPLRGRHARESHRALPALQQGASDPNSEARNGATLLGFAAARAGRCPTLRISVGRTRLRGAAESPRHPARPRRGSRGLREQALTQPRSPAALQHRDVCANAQPQAPTSQASPPPRARDGRGGDEQRWCAHLVESSVLDDGAVRGWSHAATMR